MRKWKSHKIVEAEPIASMGPDRMNDPTKYTLILASAETVKVDPSVFRRGFPVIGDYLVRYPDGYLSWSLKKAFEEGYTEVL